MVAYPIVLLLRARWYPEKAALLLLAPQIVERIDRVRLVSDTAQQVRENLLRCAHFDSLAIHQQTNPARSGQPTLCVCFFEDQIVVVDCDPRLLEGIPVRIRQSTDTQHRANRLEPVRRRYGSLVEKPWARCPRSRSSCSTPRS